MSFVEGLKKAKAAKEEQVPEYFCLSCASHVQVSSLTVRCHICACEIRPERYKQLFVYAENTLKYGHQYKEYYLKQQKNGNLGSIKPSLADLPEVYKYIALAIVSGIIGGASWDITKLAIINIVTKFNSLPERELKDRIDPTIDIVEIENIESNIRIFRDGLNPSENPVDALLVEEMYADGVTEHPEEADKLWKLQFQPGKQSQKNQNKARKIQSKLMNKILTEKLSEPEEFPVDHVWKNIKR